MYDIRYCPQPTQIIGGYEKSKAYLSFPYYENSANMFLGFDVMISQGLVASATEDRKVNMFELWTGKKVATPWKDKKWTDIIRCLSFQEDDYARSTGRSLIVGAGTGIDEWTW
jgi:hypothetical protein